MSSRWDEEVAMENVPVWSAVVIGVAVGGVILLAALVAMVRVLSWLEFDEDDAVPED
jgi:hypothetical protein